MHPPHFPVGSSSSSLQHCHCTDVVCAALALCDYHSVVCPWVSEWIFPPLRLWFFLVWSSQFMSHGAPFDSPNSWRKALLLLCERLLNYFVKSGCSLLSEYQTWLKAHFSVFKKCVFFRKGALIHWCMNFCLFVFVNLASASSQHQRKKKKTA